MAEVWGESSSRTVEWCSCGMVDRVVEYGDIGEIVESSNGEMVALVEFSKRRMVQWTMVELVESSNGNNYPT